MFSIKAALVATTILVGVSAAQAVYHPQNDYTREVSEQMRAVLVASSAQGFRQIVALESGGMLADQGPAVFQVLLQRGVEYRFAARGDSDSADLDLALKDAWGRELISDRDFDNTPSFTFRPNWTGVYTVQIELADVYARRSQVAAIVLARN